MEIVIIAPGGGLVVDMTHTDKSSLEKTQVGKYQMYKFTVLLLLPLRKNKVELFSLSHRLLVLAGRSVGRAVTVFRHTWAAVAAAVVQ